MDWPVTALPIRLPAPARLDYHASDIMVLPAPTNATPEQMKEYNRREAERQAVKDLAFDPMVDDPGYTSPLARE